MHKGCKRRVRDAVAVPPRRASRSLLADLPLLYYPDVAVYGFSDNRAMGPLMRRLISGGHITGTESFRLTKRIGANRMPRPVYRNEKWQGF